MLCCAHGVLIRTLGHSLAQTLSHRAVLSVLSVRCDVLCCALCAVLYALCSFMHTCTVFFFRVDMREVCMSLTVLEEGVRDTKEKLLMFFQLYDDDATQAVTLKDATTGDVKGSA